LRFFTLKRGREREREKMVEEKLDGGVVTTRAAPNFMAGPSLPLFPSYL
jgi:hypothetical protein